MYTDYKVGDTVWIFMSHHQGQMTKGQIVHEFSLPDWYEGNKHWVVEVPTSVDALLEVRDEWSMSPAKDKPIGLFQSVADRLKAAQ